MVTDLLVDFIKDEELEATHLCGVPYTALPVATLLSVAQNVPMLLRRKEAKDYGTKKLIEGVFKAGDTCLIIEDVITSGSSILETVLDLQGEDLIVNDVVVLVDREQGGIRNIEQHNIRVHALFTLSFLMHTLLDAGKLDEKTVANVSQFVANCQMNNDGSFGPHTKVTMLCRTQLPFEQRGFLSKCDMAADLFHLMANKKTNLCLAADLTKCDEILKVAEQCGPFICMLKTHIDIIEDFNEEFVRSLERLAELHNFLIMEDRKFADIGNTVSLQYSSGLHKISSWAHLVTAHSLPGYSILKGLKAGIVEGAKKRGVFLLSEMSAAGNLIDEKYKQTTNTIATEGNDVDIVAGIVCQSLNAFSFPGLIQLTPGINIEEGGDTLGQQYQSPEHAVIENGADIGVVGRGIYRAKSVEKAAALYRDRLWQAYETRVDIPA